MTSASSQNPGVVTVVFGMVAPKVCVSLSLKLVTYSTPYGACVKQDGRELTVPHPLSG
ncbi:hypothetical protein GCM10025867_50470 (plasmid) [Frondihabitans sucicola]|uniref:Uncharacterized protein n=1 Tax=Frondihabitans sucicola TaxID=1268041 RepID=A0ABM8GWG3_9MICO|nr:hypothetical protein GCM10025867_50470 [Frondihabitans sucicola]